MAKRTDSQGNYTLDGLGPLSNHKVFRVYFILFLGTYINGLTLMATFGHVVMVGASVATAISVSRYMPDIQSKLPEVGRVNFKNTSWAWAVAVVGILAYAAIFRDVTFWIVIKALAFGAVSAATIFLSTNYRSLRQRLKERLAARRAARAGGD